MWNHGVNQMTVMDIRDWTRYMEMPVRKRNLCIEIDYHLRRMMHAMDNEHLDRIRHIPDEGSVEWDGILSVMHATVDAMGTARRGPRSPQIKCTDFWSDTLNDPHISFVIPEWEHRQQLKRAAQFTPKK